MSQRFELEWAYPVEPGLTTPVRLFDAQCGPYHVPAVGHGGDEAEALIDLWTTLVDRHDPVEAIAYVVGAYERCTGKPPERPHA